MNTQGDTANKALDTIPLVKEGNTRGGRLTPVPGSLKRRPIDEQEVAGLLESQFNLPQDETRAYLKLLETPDLTLGQLARDLGVTETDASSLMNRMVSRGLIIESSGTPSRHAPLHPRMTLTNLFKMYEKDLVQSLRERRATADRVVNLLTPVYEERRGGPSS